MTAYEKLFGYRSNPVDYFTRSIFLGRNNFPELIRDVRLLLLHRDWY